ncbi:MAG TPA: Ig domain-containing protein [Jatrophihabitans sp.]|jgi:serine protease|nr:Ig domain-containing protein [Jatrophihabitans sp.]
MTSFTRSRRTTAVIGAVGLAGLALTGIATASSASAATTANPYSPANGHSYRHGVTPTVQGQAKMNAYAKAHPNATTVTGPETLSYGGGIDGIGVQSGHSKVYLVFYGNQWGTQTTDANGNAKFSNDSAGGAGAAQQMFKGIGTNGELWSADLTQWCDGAGVATGATVCPASGASYIPYQTGGVLSGVWYDNSVASPATASGHQLGVEAVNAAAHFGNTTAASNRYAYYVILSPHGTNPDSYQGQYCAWHDYNGDSTLTGGGVSSPYGDIAFSNQPYNMDSGAGCGVGFVNSPGTLDGWTMTLGHEWHEMMSDQNPAGGWTNHTGSSYNGQENSDECAWLSPGTSGGAANISFGSFGTYAEQASWSNDTNNCAISHAIVTHGTGGVTVTNPGNQTGTVGTPVSLTLSASGGTAPYTWSATGLPTGLSIGSSTGTISGTPSAAGTFSVTATATASAGGSGSTSFTWTINPTGGGCSSPGQKVTNSGFESGSTGWTASSGVIGQNGPYEPAHAGTWDAWMDGYGTTHTDTVTRSVTVPSGCTGTFTFYLHIDTSETTTTTAYDKITVKYGSTTEATYSNLNHISGYAAHTFTVPAGTNTISFSATEDVSLQTSFVLDDITVTAS